MNTIAKNLDRQVTKGTLTEAEKKTTLANITVYTDCGWANRAELVVEAATENLELKLKIFKDIDAFAKRRQPFWPAILLQYRSPELLRSRNARDKVIGMHFMNPVPVMKLVEVINGLCNQP